MNPSLSLAQQLDVLDTLAEEMARTPDPFDAAVFRQQAQAFVVRQAIPATPTQVEAALVRLIDRYSQAPATPSKPAPVPLGELAWDRPTTPEAHQAELARLDAQLAPAFAALDRTQQGDWSPIVWPGLCIALLAWVILEPLVSPTLARAGWTWGMGLLGAVGFGSLIIDVRATWRAWKAKPVMAALAPRRQALTPLSDRACKREQTTWALVPEAAAYARRCMADGIGVLSEDAKRLKSVCLPAMRRQTQAAKATSPARAAMLQELRAELRRHRQNR